MNKEKMLSYYNKANDYLRQNVLLTIVITLVVLILFSFISNFVTGFGFNGTWELDDMELEVDGDTCKFIEDDDSEKYDCEVSGGKLIIEADYYYYIGQIIDGQLVLTTGYVYDKD